MTADGPHPSAACPHCGEPLGSAAAFCRGCGSPVGTQPASRRRPDPIDEAPVPPAPLSSVPPAQAAAPPLPPGATRSRAPLVIGALVLALGTAAIVAIVLIQGSHAGGSTTTVVQRPRSEAPGADTAAVRVAGLTGVAAVQRLISGIPQGELTLGDAGAPVELIEFADLQCPVCKSYAEEELPAVIEGPVAEGIAKLAFRNFLIIGPQSLAAGTAALAAGRQGRGWSFIELFYRNQGEEDSGYVNGPFLRSIAEGAGVKDVAKWEEEREGSPLREEAERTTRQAERFGFDGTPSFAVQGPNTAGLELIGTPSSASELLSAIKAAS